MSIGRTGILLLIIMNSFAKKENKKKRKEEKSLESCMKSAHSQIFYVNNKTNVIFH